MHFSQTPYAGKRKYAIGLILLLFGCSICVAFSFGRNNDFSTARREVMLRRIGHELLLQSGDSTSRVLPVEKIAENEYRIRFENAFTFKPDFLVNATRQLLAKDPLANDYVVNVLNENARITYGYAISQTQHDDIVPCKGRLQPKARYSINIKFKPSATISASTAGYLLGSLPFLAFVGFSFLTSGRQQKLPSNGQRNRVFTFGAVNFTPQERLLTIMGETIDLTGTETRLLLIFASLPNQVIERSRLQKEIWEDEGVIVGRSLDMFISKLRKKLEPALNCNILVVRGKGYKFEVVA